MPEPLAVAPMPGTPEFDQFVSKAKRDPNGVEAKALAQMMQEATQQHQQMVRDKLMLMIEVVPGQLFRDVARFHEKFGLAPTDDPNHELPEDLLYFRIKFMREELDEYAQAMGYSPMHPGERLLDDVDVEKAFDALIDLTYVALGTAFLHRFPFNEGWARVQEANMQKVRADSADDPRSLRKHSADVVKPEGWQAPVLRDLLGLKEDKGEQQA